MKKSSKYRKKKLFKPDFKMVPAVIPFIADHTAGNFGDLPDDGEAQAVLIA